MPGSILLTYDFPPMPGGIARAMGEIARHARPGNLIVSTGQVAGSEAFDRSCTTPVDRMGVSSERLRTFPGLGRWAWRADRLVHEHRARFLWAGNLRPAGRVARWTGGRRRVPYGLITYGLDVALMAQQAATRPMKQRAARRLLGDAAGIVAISGWTADRVRDLAGQLGLPRVAERVRVVPLGVDAARFRPGLATDRVRVKYDLGPRQWLLTVARLVPHKGIDVGLRALADLRKAGIDVGYAIAGEGPARAALERLAAELGVREFVRWCGFVPEEELPALYGVADVYLGLSREEEPEVEGFGLALLEAQASGLPVVAGESGGTSDALLPGVSGMLVPPTAHEEIHRVLAELLRDPARAGALGAAGRVWTAEARSWSRVVEELDRAADGFTCGLPARGGR
jgi:phosphatidylinositol alpha-1,6-mannosyltransferase